MVSTIATGSPLAVLQGNGPGRVTAEGAAAFSQAVDAAIAVPRASSDMTKQVFTTPTPERAPKPATLTALAAIESALPVEAVAMPPVVSPPAMAEDVDGPVALAVSPSGLVANATPATDGSVRGGADGRVPAEHGKTAATPATYHASRVTDEEVLVSPAPIAHDGIAAPERIDGRKTAPADRAPVVPLAKQVSSGRTAAPSAGQGDDSTGNEILPGVLTAQLVPAAAASSIGQGRPSRRSIEIALPTADALQGAGALRSPASSALPSADKARLPDGVAPPQAEGEGLATGAPEVRAAFTAPDAAVARRAGANEVGLDASPTARDQAARPSRKARLAANPTEAVVSAALPDASAAIAAGSAVTVTLPSSAVPQDRPDVGQGAVSASGPIEAALVPAAVDVRKAGSIEFPPRDGFAASSPDTLPFTLASADRAPAETPLVNGQGLALLSADPLAHKPATHNTNVAMTAATNMPPVVTAHPGQIGHELGVEIARRISAGGDELQVRLNPADLGRIEVRMTFDERGGLRAVIAAASPVALDMLRRDSADLSRSLNDAGVRSDAQALQFQSSNGNEGNKGQPRNPWADSTNSSLRSGRDNLSAPDAELVTYHHLRTSGRYDLMA